MSHSERDLLLELFPETAKELFGDGATRRQTIGLYRIGDGKLAFVNGPRLFEFEPIEPHGKNAFHCDLCHATRSRHEVGVYRVELVAHRYRYVTLCINTDSCQERAGRNGLLNLADKMSAVH